MTPHHTTSTSTSVEEAGHTRTTPSPETRGRTQPPSGTTLPRRASHSCLPAGPRQARVRGRQRRRQEEEQKRLKNDQHTKTNRTGKGGGGCHGESGRIILSAQEALTVHHRSTLELIYTVYSKHTLLHNRPLKNISAQETE